MVREAERRAGRALLAMIDEKGLSLREAVDWCGNGVTLREMTWLRRLAQEVPGGTVDERWTWQCGPAGPRCANVNPGDGTAVSLKVGPGAGGWVVGHCAV